MKVLFVYKYLTLGGVETVLRARLDAFDGNMQPLVWFLQDGPGREIFRGKEHNLRVGSLRELAAFLQRETFDLHVTIDTPEVFQLRHSRNRPLRWLVEFHTPYTEAQHYLRRLTAENTIMLLTPSLFQARLARRLLVEDLPVRVCPNPLRDVFLAPPEAAPAGGKAIVGWLGRMDNLKNWQGFLQLAALLNRHSPDLQYWLIGDSPQRQPERDLENLARRFGVYRNLRWYRGVDHRHVPRFLDMVRASGGVLLSTSFGESFGMTIAEGMARCCPVVVPDRSPFCEFVQEGESGFFYQVEHLESALGPIQRLLGDRTLRAAVGRSARQAVVHDYRPDRVMSVLLQTLQEALRTAGERKQLNRLRTPMTLRAQDLY